MALGPMVLSLLNPVFSVSLRLLRAHMNRKVPIAKFPHLMWFLLPFDENTKPHSPRSTVRLAL